MKKLLALVLSVVIVGCSVTSAVACVQSVAMSDGGGSGRSGNTNTATQHGGINQNATVQGDENVVSIRQIVNAGGNHYYDQRTVVNNEITIVQVVEPELEPKPDYDKMREVIAVYGEAFLRVLSSRLRSEGWVMLWSVDVAQTHNYVVSVNFIHETGIVLDDYKIQYYTSDGEHYLVALTTVYHHGWRLADYPASEVVFLGLSETDFVEMTANWLYAVRISFASSGCGCCGGCNCDGGCGEGCMCPAG